MSVVPYSAPHQTDSRQWVELMTPAIELAKAVAQTEFVPKALRNNPAAITAAILYGDEVGLGPMQALAKIAVIDGKPTLAAEAQRALILAAGHDLWIEESTNTRCVIGGRRRGSDASSRVTWTMDDAKRANLAGKQNWRSYPRAMLLARASAELARAVFADAIGGLAATEELEDLDGPGPATRALEAAPDPEPPKTTTRRRRAPRATPAATVSAPPPPPAGDELPPLPDEEPPPPVDDGPPLANDAQRRKLFALFNERGITDRDDRLDWSNHHLDRTIVSSAELTVAEASTLIDALELEVDALEAAAGAEGDPGPDPGPAAETGEQIPLGDQTITADRVDILSHLRREANVDDAWLRVRLAALGVENYPQRITRAVIAQLTVAQAIALGDALNSEIDRIAAEEDDEL